MNISPRGYLNSQVSGLYIYGAVPGRRERTHANILSIKSHKEMMHASITDCGHVNDIPLLDACRNSSSCRDFIKTLNYLGTHYLGAVLVGHIIGNTGHHIFTVNYLRIHHRLSGYHLATGQLAEVTNYRGGAYVKSYTISLFNSSRLYQDNLFILPYRHRYLPVALAHHALLGQQCLIVNSEIFQAILLSKFRLYTLKVTQRVLQGSLLHLHIIFLHRWLYLKPRYLPGCLAHNLLCQPTLLRDEDHNITMDTSLACQPVTFLRHMVTDKLLLRCRYPRNIAPF